MLFWLRLSDLDAVAKGEADAAVGVDRRMIQQFSPGFLIEFRHLLRQFVQGADELLRCCFGGNQGGDLPGHFIMLSLDTVVWVN